MHSTQLFQMGEQQNAVDLAISHLLSPLLSMFKKLEKTTFPSQIQTKLFYEADQNSRSTLTPQIFLQYNKKRESLRFQQMYDRKIRFIS